jgi:hypothetical protein
MSEPNASYDSSEQATCEAIPPSSSDSTQTCPYANQCVAEVPCDIDDVVLAEIQANRKTTYSVARSGLSLAFTPEAPKAGKRSVSLIGSGGVPKGKVFEVVAGPSTAAAKTVIEAHIRPHAVHDATHLVVEIRRPGQAPIVEAVPQLRVLNFPVFRTTSDNRAVRLIERYWSAGYSPTRNEICIHSCGIRNSGQALGYTQMEVLGYPSEQVTLELSVPALKKSSYSLERARTATGRSVEKRERERMDGVKVSETTTRSRDGSTEEYKGSFTHNGRTTEAEEWISTGDGITVTFTPDLVEKAAEPDRPKVSLKVDGTEQDVAHDITKLLDTLAKLKKGIDGIKELLEDWVPQVGFKFEFDVSFLAGSMGLTWGWREHTDHRAFFGLAGIVELMLIQLSLMLSFGVKIGPAATARVEGGIKDSSVKLTDQFGRMTPDRPLSATTKAKAEIPLVLQGYAEANLLVAEFRAAAGVKSGFTVEGGTRLGDNSAFEMYLEIAWNGLDAYRKVQLNPDVGEEEDVVHLIDSSDIYKGVVPI